MELLQPWRTQIAKINVADQVDLEAIVQELLSIPRDQNHDLTISGDLDQELVANILKLHEEIVVPKAYWYMSEVLDYPVTHMSRKTWGVVLADGLELVPHYHAGSLLTTVFYPIDSEAHLTLFDPRGNACRGYPVEIRDKHFKNCNLVPRAGDLYVFPSYIHHYVTPTHNALRLSIATDFFLD